MVCNRGAFVCHAAAEQLGCVRVRGSVTTVVNAPTETSLLTVHEEDEGNLLQTFRLLDSVVLGG